MVIGNNDFRVPPSGGTNECSNEQLSNIVKNANFDVLLSNVKDKEGKYIKGMHPYTIKNINGINVGIIVVTSLKPKDRMWPEVYDKVFEPGDVAVKNIIDEVSKKADIIIVLSHAGIAVDTIIATIPKVSAVIGADDHFVLKKAMYNTYSSIPGTISPPITQNGGEKENYLGRIDLTFEKINGDLHLVDFNDVLYEDLKNVKEDQMVKKIINSYKVKKTNKTSKLCISK